MGEGAIDAMSDLKTSSRRTRSTAAKAYLRANPNTARVFSRMKGGEIVQDRINAYCETVAFMYEDLQKTGEIPEECWESLATITRPTAFRIASYLPEPLIREGITAEEYSEMKKLKAFNLGVSAWLLYWEKQGNLDELIQQGFGNCQPYALLSKRRFDLIQGLFDLKRFPQQSFPKPSFIWLLSEISVCIGRLKEMRIQYKGNSNQEFVSSRRKYKLFKLDTDSLNDLAETLEVRPSESAKELLERFWEHIDVKGREEARANPIFDAQYWKPYIGARKAFNVSALAAGAKPMVNTLPKRRGPQIGESKVRDSRIRKDKGGGGMLSNVK